MSSSSGFIPYGKQWIDDDDIAAVVAVLKSDYLTQGPAVDAFESALAEYAGAPYAVVFSSGTAALHAAYFAAGVGAGDEIITSPLTFAATSNACLYLGARPVFIDIETDTGNIKSELAVSAVGKNTRAVVPVHYAGHPVDMESLERVARRHDLFVIEDACHALGAYYKGDRIGSCRHSDMAVFSFHPVKHITTGEGGAVLTRRKEFYSLLRQFRTHGITREHFIDYPGGGWYYEMQHLGYNYRMTDLQAALGLSQLKRLDMFVERRRAIASYYDSVFRNNPFFDTPPEREYAHSSYHLYPLRLRDDVKDKRSAIFSRMREEGLGVQVHYMPVYLQPYYRQLGYTQGACPSAEDFYQREISIPLYPALKDSEKEQVAVRILKAFENI